MPPQNRYLSTDPNAGAEPPESGTSRYLSTDPNAGQPSPDAGAPPEDRSVAGFLGNAVQSGANFVGNAVNGARMLGNAHNALLFGPAAGGFEDTRRLAESMYGAGPRLVQGAKDYFSNRYGSTEALGNTLYTDPVGVAADASTVLSLGGSALGTVPGRVGQAGRALSAAGAAVDPTAVAARAAGAVTRQIAAGTDLVADALGPGRVLAEQGDLFGGAPRVITQPREPSQVGRMLRTVAAGGAGHAIGDPTGGVASALAMQAFESPAVRASIARGMRNAGQTLTRSSQAAVVSPEVLTRLAVLSQLQGTQGAP